MEWTMQQDTMYQFNKIKDEDEEEEEENMFGLSVDMWIYHHRPPTTDQLPRRNTNRFYMTNVN